MEKLVRVVKAYSSGQPDSLIIVIPKEVRDLTKFKAGQKFSVKLDHDNRLIYEPIEVQTE